MKKFARCLLILILVVILSVVGGYFYEDSTITPMYESVSKIYVVPGSDSEASIRAKDGGLNKDFMIIFQVMLLLKLLRGLLVHRRIFLNILLLHLQQIVTL